MTTSLARTAVAVTACLALVGCNTADAPLPTDDETATVGPARCPSGRIVGAGSAVQRAAFEEVGAAYEERCGDRSDVQYDVVPADVALAAFSEEKADWLAVDEPLDAATRATVARRCSPYQLLSLPLVANPIALPYHVPGIDRLVLSAPVAARIFDGTITTWDHPDIVALNPGVQLPAERIAVVGRADSSAVTTELSRWLAEAGGWPTEKVGPDWAGVGEKEPETTGVIQALQATPFSLGYAEFSAALDNRLPAAWVDGGAGPVELTSATAGKTLAEAATDGSGGDLTLTPNLTGTAPGSYPLVLVGYQVVCASGLEPGKAPALRDFLGFVASEQEQQSLAELGLAPLPPGVGEQVTEAAAQIR